MYVMALPTFFTGVTADCICDIRAIFVQMKKGFQTIIV